MAGAASGRAIDTGGAPPTHELPRESEILARADGENFSVASVLLGRRLHAQLTALYGYARLVDQIGDAVAGDRLAALDACEHDLLRIFAGDHPEHPILRRLEPVVHELDLPRGPFLRLLEANRRDQQLVAYATFAELEEYCDLSANPVGELVLHLFGAATPDRIALSDRVCTALQLAEHWQDVSEDRAAGRIYLPAEDMERFEVTPTDLDGTTTPPRLRSLIAFQVARARELLSAGAPLVGLLRGRARVAVAGYVAGGRTALDAIDAAGHDVLAGAPHATVIARARATIRTAVAGR